MRSDRFPVALKLISSSGGQLIKKCKNTQTGKGQMETAKKVTWLVPAMQETWVQSQGQEDPLEKGMATHSNILAWEIPWTEEPDGLLTVELQRVGHD